MDKKLLKWLIIRTSLAIIIISPISIFYSLYLTQFLKTPTPDMAWVSWYDNPQNEVYIGWETIEETTAIIKYGTNQDNLVSSIIEPSSALYHTINLTGLSPETKYYYEIQIDGNKYTTGEFLTAPSIEEDFSFGLTSDTQQKVGPGWHKRTASILDEKEYAFVAMIGDFVEDGTKAEWNDFFSTASEYLDTLPIVPVRGNHDKPRDLEGNGEVVQFFNTYFPQSEDIQMNLNEYDKYQQFYYSFNWSNVHFQILHFPEVDVDDTGEPDGVNPKDYYSTFTADQLVWIEDDLENAQDLDFRVTMFHCPITGAGFYGENHILIDELLPILHNYNVSATIHGHAHHYERGLLENPIHSGNDISYFIVGCGGGLVDVGLTPVPETEICTASPCYTEVSVTSDAMEFVTYTFDNEIVDNHTIYALNNGGI